jgi:hypothetical protein
MNDTTISDDPMARFLCSTDENDKCRIRKNIFTIGRNLQAKENELKLQKCGNATFLAF